MNKSLAYSVLNAIIEKEDIPAELVCKTFEPIYLPDSIKAYLVKDDTTFMNKQVHANPLQIDTGRLYYFDKTERKKKWSLLAESCNNQDNIFLFSYPLFSPELDKVVVSIRHHCTSLPCEWNKKVLYEKHGSDWIRKKIVSVSID